MEGGKPIIVYIEKAGLLRNNELVPLIPHKYGISNGFDQKYQICKDNTFQANAKNKELHL